MTVAKRSVLITGCSDGGIGSALATAFRDAGLHVYATARSPSKMKALASSAGIQTLTLDIMSEESIAACVKSIDSLDVLVNNAGEQHTMPILDLDIAEAKKTFDLNVWSQLAVIQAFMPLLRRSSNAMVINHSSSAAIFAVPLAGTYHASKAAISMFTDVLRLELQPFNIKVVDLRTAIVKTNIIQAVQSNRPRLPEGSIYEPARAEVEKAMGLEGFDSAGMSADVWARDVVKDVTKQNPPARIMRGESAWTVALSTWLPHGMFDGMIKKMTGFANVEKILRSS